MALNFNEIANEIETPITTTSYLHTVSEELNARQSLLQQRFTKCENIAPLYETPKKTSNPYTYKYFCVCSRYNPQYPCKHTDNIIIDRDVITPLEHLIHLATPKENIAAPRKPPRFYQKKFILPNCTTRINKLSAPSIKHVSHTLTHYKHLLAKRNRAILKQHLKEKPKVEYTDIATALEWLAEEKRLKKVAKRMEQLQCQKLSRKILKKQRMQIKKMIAVLYEEMKEYLLDDSFLMEESSPLMTVILKALNEFTDKEFNISSNLMNYQKIIAFNLAIWINNFTSSLNIQIAEKPNQPPSERTTNEFNSFLPVADYIAAANSESDELYYENEKTYQILLSEEDANEDEQTLTQPSDDMNMAEIETPSERIEQN